MDKILRNLFIKKVFKNNKGSALIASLVVGVLLSTFGMGYLGLLVTETRNVEKTHRSNLALHIAESGIEDAIWVAIYKSGDFLTYGYSDEGSTFEKVADLTTRSGEKLGSYVVTVPNPFVGSAPIIIGAVGKALFRETDLAEARTIEVTLQMPNGPVSIWHEK